MGAQYKGRLYSQDGNLFASQREFVKNQTITVTDDEGESHEAVVPVYKIGKDDGKPVKHVLGKGYFFVDEGESTHFEDHHRQYVEVSGTTPDDPHHFAALPDDPHYDPQEPGNTKPKSDPDTVGRTVTSHTDAYKES